MAALKKLRGAKRWAGMSALYKQLEARTWTDHEGRVYTPMGMNMNGLSLFWGENTGIGQAIIKTVILPLDQAIACTSGQF